MVDNEDKSPSLQNITADANMISLLYSNGLINNAGRQYALDYLSPQNEWGLWTSRLCLTIGSSLVLSGIIYFFAFNWAVITPFTKFSIIQGALLLCLAGACFFSLQKIPGQTLLLAASVLVGVFMAVFGQIYQTGADAYQLFMMWSLFILGWTVISNFNAQWILWLVVTNLFLGLWWEQAALPSADMKHMIFVYIMLLNGAVLAAREYFVRQGFAWLNARWTRLLLALGLLTTGFIPVFNLLIMYHHNSSVSLILAAICGVLLHTVFLYLYRFKIKDIWVLTLTTLSSCTLLETAMIRFLYEATKEEFAILFLGGFLTIALFTGATIYLRRTFALMGASHD